MKIFLSKFLSKQKTLILIFTVSFLTSSVVLANYAEASSISPDVNIHSQKEIVSYYESHPTGEIGFDYDGNKLSNYTIEYSSKPLATSPYSLGLLSDSELSNALNTLRIVRYIAGISDNIYLSDDYTQFAQASSLVNYANNVLTHNPTAPKNMDSNLVALGISGSQHSNIARTMWQNNSLKWTIINGWMDDSDYLNIKVLGHRRWLLNPAMGMTGFGSVTGTNGTFNAMYAMDDSNFDKDYNIVCWPSYNMPLSYFPVTSPWSVSINIDPNMIVERNVNVVLVREKSSGDKDTWYFSNTVSDGDFYIDKSSYGTGSCIIFRPNDIVSYNKNDVFYVYISGLPQDINYEVHFFDMEKYYSLSAPTFTGLTLNSLSKPSLVWNKQSKAESYNVYRKVYGGDWKLLSSDVSSPTFDDKSTGKGIKYYYKITSVRNVNDTDYESNFSTSKSITIPLSKVTISSLSAISKGKNTLKWKSVSKATGYKVYRRKYGTSTWSLIKTTSNTSYSNTSAKSGTTYEYRIRAYRTYKGNTVYGDYSAGKESKDKIDKKRLMRKRHKSFSMLFPCMCYSNSKAPLYS